jgi:hypothetical protein
MHIETYIIEETQNLIYEDNDLQEWNKLAEEIGLTKQAQLAQKGKSPIPFLPMNTRITNILTELCPTSVDIKNYTLTPIPLEVLKLISLSIRERYFGDIKIMYDETSKDPACIGITPGVWIDNASGSKQSQYGAFHSKEEAGKYIEENNLEGHRPYSYGGQKYLMARWADIKQSWEELAERAKDRFCASKSAQLEKEINEKKTDLLNIKNEAVIKFG